MSTPHILLKHTAVATDYRYQLVSLDISIPRLLNTRHNVFQYGARGGTRTRMPFRARRFKRLEYTYFSTLANLKQNWSTGASRPGHFQQQSLRLCAEARSLSRYLICATNSGEAYWNRTSVGKSLYVSEHPDALYSQCSMFYNAILKHTPYLSLDSVL